MTRHADWNLEIAHVTWGGIDADDSINESVVQGLEWIARWESTGASYTVCSLVDDKEVVISDRAGWLDIYAKAYPKLFGLLDFVCFESDLISLKNEFLARFEPPRRGKVERELERYREKHGKVACSHDIAIWHSLRLGLLPSGFRLMNPLKQTVQGPYGNQLLSILEEEDRAPEERAKEMLRYTEDGAAKRIHVEFYA